MSDHQQDQALPSIRVIEGDSKPIIDWAELWAYRDLFYFLVWRNIKARYAQSVLGVGWAVIQPVFRMIIFTIVFGNLAEIDSDGVPYAIFSYTALVPWTYFSGALTSASSSLIGASGMITKVYFPRLILPITAVLGKLLDLLIAFALVSFALFWFGRPPTLAALFIPILVIFMILSASGLGMLLTALAVQYRDIRYAMSFIVQLMMYVSPVIFSTQAVIPENLQLVYAINPMVGVIEGFRASLLGGVPMPWHLIAVSGTSAVLIFTIGALYFKRMERHFADVA